MKSVHLADDRWMTKAFDFHCRNEHCSIDNCCRDNSCCCSWSSGGCRDNIGSADRNLDDKDDYWESLNAFEGELNAMITVEMMVDHN